MITPSELAKEYVNRLNNEIKGGKHVMYKGGEVKEIEIVELVNKIKIHIIFKDGTEILIPPSVFLASKINIF